MQKIIYCLLIIFTSYLSYSQVLTEKEMIEKLDSITKQLNPDDPDYESKAAKLIEKFRNEMEHRLLIGDTTYVIGSEAAERVISEMKTIFDNEIDTSYLSYDYLNELPYLIVDLSNNDNRFTIDQVGSFSNLKILIIKGDLSGNLVDMDFLFSKIENIELTELHVFNCHGGVTYLPEKIGNLTSLVKLSLFGNAINKLPDSLSSLTSLEELYMDINPISELPKGIGNLKRLKVLGIAKTEIQTSEINRIKSLLPNCKILTQ